MDRLDSFEPRYAGFLLREKTATAERSRSECMLFR